jgi:hypothetical protein
MRKLILTATMIAAPLAIAPTFSVKAELLAPAPIVAQLQIQVYEAPPVAVMTPRPIMAFSLSGLLTGLIDQFMPFLNQYLQQYLQPILGGVGMPIFQGVFDYIFGNLLGGGSVTIGGILNAGVNPASQAISNATGVNQGLVQQGLSGIVNNNPQQVLQAGVGYLTGLLNQNSPNNQGSSGGINSSLGSVTPSVFNPGGGTSTTGNGSPTTTNPNGTTSGSGTGSLPSGSGGSASSGTSTGGTGTLGSVTGGTGTSGPTGSVNCVYQSGCVAALPSSYQSSFQNAIGAMGIPDPNYMRSQVYQSAQQGQMPDNFVTNPNTGAFYISNELDRQLTRASAAAYLSKEGQQAQKATNEATLELLKAKQKMTEQGVKAKSSQNVLKSLLGVTSVTSELQAAQLGVSVQTLTDNQWTKLNTANVSAAADQERRVRDSELSSQSYNALYQTLTVYTPY